MNLDHLYFDIVSDLELRISDFASLGIFTLVENSLQINLFMQNKPNFRKSQMNVSIYLQKACENISNWTLGENKPNSNPNKPNCRKVKIDAKCVFTKDYERNDIFAVPENKANSNPIKACPERSRMGQF